MTKNKNQTVNPLCLFDIRRSKVALPFFEYITVPAAHPHSSRTRIMDFFQDVCSWIEQNLRNRYYAELVAYSDNSNLKNLDLPISANALHVGFEDPKEMSLFILSCPHLNLT